MSVKKLKQNKYRILLTVLGILLAVLIFQPIELSLAEKGGNSSNEITACATQSPKNYTQFVESDFSLTNVAVDPTTKFLTLNTGSQAIDPNNIVVPFDQEVSVTFIFEGAGYTKTDFGWFFASDVSTAKGTLNSDGTANFYALQNLGLTHEIYYDVNDNNYSYNSGNGVLDKSASSTADRYSDTNGDGKTDVMDNTIVLGKFTGGTELAFYLKVDDQTCGSNSCVYFTKTAWNPDFFDTCRDNTGSGTKAFTREFKLGVAGGESFNTSSGWLTQTAIDRMKTYFGITLSGSRNVTYQRGVKHPHVIVGAPPNDPNQWVLGWDDQKGCTPDFRVGDKKCGSDGKSTCTNSNCDSQTCRSDMDTNDLVFRINRKTGGTAALTSAQAIKPSDPAAYFTGVTFEVYDDMPCSGQTTITYSVSPDNGTTWIDILDWDEVYVSSANKTQGAAVSNWSPGKPEYTLRRATIDFLSSGKVGQAFLWKASMFSDSDACIPRVMGVNLGFSIAKHGTFARSAPVTMVNMLYSGNYETPDPLNATWTDMTLRGHLIYTRLYQPDDPSKTAINPKVLDAGEILLGQNVSSRKIYYPDVTLVEVSENIGKGDSTDGTNGTKKFSGKILHQPMQDGSLVITDGTEKFTEDVEDTLKGSFEGSGIIDRFTGEYTITFKNPPWINVPITATYRYYKMNSGLKSFATGAGVTPALLGLTSDWSYNASGAKVYTDDFNKDGKMDQSDADWLVNWTRGYKDGVNNKKSWLLGAIDHSTPAVAVPPGRPAWYYGTATTKEERDSYKAFADENANRRVTLYVGARDGMLHAFDAGIFKWGDNPKTTTITENIGYFEWSGNTPSDSDYGSAEERWAFIPINLMSRLKNNYKGASKQSYVDASPTVADVFINNKWVSILMTAEGNGGDTVVCLDVTDPSNPKFLWEYANTELYKSKSSPSVARLAKIKTGNEIKWVAFFVSAKSNPAKYPAIYVVDIANGSLLKKIYLYAAELGTTGLGGIPSGQPDVVDFNGDGYADRLYIGANCNLDKGIGNGYLYKVNISGDDNWQTCILNSSVSNPLPIFGSPVAIVDRGYDDDGNLIEGVKIFYGTGDSPYKNDDVSASTVFSFYGFDDKDSNTTCTPITEGPSFQMDFPAGEKVWTSAFASAGQIYFGTTTADTEDPCDGYGTSTSASANVYVLGETESGTMQVVHKIEDTPNNNVPPLVDDGHLYIRGPDGKIKSYGSGKYNNAQNIYGVAQPPKQKTWREVY